MRLANILRGPGRVPTVIVAASHAKVRYAARASAPAASGNATAVSTHHEVNSRKANRLPHEAGLRLRKQPVAPRVVPASALIRNRHGVRDWEHFLG